MAHASVPHESLQSALRLTADMARATDPGGLLQRGLSLCRSVLVCDRALIIAREPGEQPRILDALGGEGARAPFSTTALRLVSEQEKPLLISDTIENTLLSAQQSINENQIRSVLCTLLSIDREPGAERRVFLYLDSRSDRHPFSQNDLTIFSLLADLMSTLVEKSGSMARQEAALEELRTKVEQRQFEELIFDSPAFGDCLKLVKQSAVTDVPILLSGETGTGKELLAAAIHRLSDRRENPFLAVNCGAIPSNLIESELFGHEKGAFTGAVAVKKGYFESAHTGTLFLDEVGELPSAVQTRFLRVLQEGEVTRIGSTRAIPVHVRVVSATNVDLESAIQAGTFRKDLYYRLNVMQIRVPPVRERGEDSLLLARFFLTRFAESAGLAPPQLSRQAEKAIVRYNWPGNVREIRNLVQRAAIIAQNRAITPDDLGFSGHDQKGLTSLREAREAVDREMIALALQRSPGNLTNAAKILDIDRKSLRLLLEKYGIEAG